MARFATEYGAFEIDSMPSQCQVALCHGFFVQPECRGKGYGHKLKQYQNEVLFSQGFDYAQCTVSANNAAQLRVLHRAGWRRIGSFHNRRLGGHTEVWGYQVKKESGEQ